MAQKMEHIAIFNQTRVGTLNFDNVITVRDLSSHHSRAVPAVVNAVSPKWTATSLFTVLDAVATSPDSRQRFRGNNARLSLWGQGSTA